MNGLIALGIFVLFGIAVYLFYNAGLFDDIINRIKTQTDSIKIPEIDLFGKKTRERERLAEVERRRILDEERQRMKERIKAKTKPVDNRRSDKGQRITEWELGYIWDGIVKRRRVPCFNCLNADMFTSNNNNSVLWYCPNCGQSINLRINGGDRESVVCENLGIDVTKIQ